MTRNLLSALAFLWMALPTAQAQDTATTTPPPAPQAEQKPELRFYPKASIEIQGLLNEEESFTAYLLIGSDTELHLRASLKPLLDAEQSTFLHEEHLSLSPEILDIEPGQSAELSFTIEPGSDPGNYAGALELREEGGGGSWVVPVKASLRRKTEAQFFGGDEGPQAINTAGRSLLNFLLPRHIRQDGINVRIENLGSSELEVANISLALKGSNTNAALTEKLLRVDSSLLRSGIGPMGLATLSLPFDQEALKKLPADAYEGEFRVYFKNAAEPLSAALTVNKRMGAFWAILLLLLGIIAGRWIKGLDSAKEQMELMERFVPLRIKVDKLTDKLAQKQLWDELAQLEAEINKVKDEDSKAAVEELFPSLEKKAAQIRELEALHERLKEQFQEEKTGAEAKSQASQQLRAARDAILDGREDEAQEALRKIEELIESLSQDKAKGIIDEVIIPAAFSVKRQIGKVFETFREKSGGVDREKEISASEQFFFRAVQLLSGVKMSARFRYGVIRPLITFATFIVLLLLGFNEIYISGGETFGAAGITDCLKLFLWGVVSDVFSRSLTDPEGLAAGFMNK